MSQEWSAISKAGWKTATQETARSEFAFHYPFIKPRVGIQDNLEDFTGHTKDIEVYLEGNLDESDPLFKASLSDLILEKAHGVFMWAILVVDEVNKVYNKGLTRNEQLTKLRELPPDLHQLFAALLHRHPEDMEDFVFASFWILFVARPLSPTEFDHALWIASVTYGSQSRQMPDSQEANAEDRIRMRVISATKGLAEITAEQSPRVLFIHESVRDFLRKEQWLSKYWPSSLSGSESSTSQIPPESRVHNMLKACCREYLEQAWKASDSAADPRRQYLMNTFQFLDYACQNLLHRANCAAPSISQNDFLDGLPLDQLTETYNYFKKRVIRRYPQGTPMIYILADRGHAELIRGLPSLPPLDLRCAGRFESPLLAAASKSDADTVAALLGLSLMDRQKMDIWDRLKRKRSDVEGCEGRTPLSWAAKEGSSDIVQHLLSQDVSINEGRGRGNALLAAIDHGHQTIMKTLLQKGADTGAPSHECRKILRLAASNGRVDRVKALLDNGAEVDGPDSSFETPLQHASRRGHEEVVELILQRGADVNAQRRYGVTPLLAASSNGFEKIVQSLLKQGADVHATDGNGRTALRTASRQGYEGVAGLLIQNLANANYTGPGWHQALCEASRMGHTRVVEMLLDNGADVNAKDEEGSTALRTASGNGHDKVVKLLLERGADEKAQSPDWRMALEQASRSGHANVVKLLLDKGPDVDAHERVWGDVLRAASRRGHTEVAELLLDKGVDVNIRGRWDRRTALQLATNSGCELTVKMLIDRGAV